MSTTSTTPHARPGYSARRNLLRPRPDSRISTDAGPRRPPLGTALAVAGLAGLMGLTSWVVARVSVWLVPVYLIVMTLIFALPRAPRPEASERAGGGDEEVSDRAQGPIAGPSGSDPPSESQVRMLAEPSADGPPEASASGPDPSGPASSEAPISAKPRRGRGRTRKGAKASAEQPSAAAPATWIRVGPGKFVRAGSQDQVPAAALPAPIEETAATTESALAEAPAPAAPIEPVNRVDIPAPFEEAVIEVNPEPGSPVTVMTTDVDLIAELDHDIDNVIDTDPAREEPSSADAPETGATGQACPAGPLGPEPAAEEYGIAPSAFGPDVSVQVSDSVSACGSPSPSASNASVEHEDAPHGPLAPPDAGADALAAETEIEPIPDAPPAPESDQAENHPRLLMAADHDSAPVEAGPSGKVSRTERPWNQIRSGGLRLKPRSRPARGSGRASASNPGPGVAWSSRNVRSGNQFRSSARLKPPANPRLRHQARRSFGRQTHVHRGFHSRSPPEQN